MSLARAINDAHPPASDFFQNLIITDAPIGIAHVDFAEQPLESALIFALRAETTQQQAIQTKPTPDARGRSTLFAGCDLGLDPHRIENADALISILGGRQSRAQIAQLFIHIRQLLHGLRDFCAQKFAITDSQFVDQAFHRRFGNPERL